MSGQDMTPEDKAMVERSIAASAGWARHTLESLLNHAVKQDVPKVIACAELIVEAMAGMAYLTGETPREILGQLDIPIEHRRQEIALALSRDGESEGVH